MLKLLSDGKVNPDKAARELRMSPMEFRKLLEDRRIVPPQLQSTPFRQRTSSSEFQKEPWLCRECIEWIYTGHEVGDRAQIISDHKKVCGLPHLEVPQLGNQPKELEARADAILGLKKKQTKGGKRFVLQGGAFNPR